LASVKQIEPKVSILFTDRTSILGHESFNPDLEKSFMESAPPIRIADLDLFADCSKAELRQIDSLTTYLQLSKDRVLMKEGSPAKQFIIIGSGTARISRETEEGTATVADVGSGEFIGEMELLAGTPRAATATAATDLAVLVSSASEFQSILDIAPSVARKVRRASEMRAASLDLAA
jgi:CRP-like cAMP-binding protein